MQALELSGQPASDGRKEVMTHYRCYLLNGTDHFVSVDSIQSDQGEADALDKARTLLATKYKDAHAVEVWDRAKLVGKIENEAKPKHSLESLLKHNRD